MTKDRVCANDTAMSRRTLLAALPVTGMALALPANAVPEDPILPLYRKWLDARSEWRELADLPGNEDWDDPRSIDATKRETDAEIAMLASTPSTKEGIAALAALAWAYVDPGDTDREEYELRTATYDCQAIMAIWRTCTGKSGYPAT